MTEQDITIEQPQIEIPKLETPPTTVEEWAAFSGAQAEAIQELTRQVANLTETVQYLIRKLFGSSSEKSGVAGQLSLFNEAEAEADPDAREPSMETVVESYRRNRKSRGTRDEILGELPVKRIPCSVAPDERICEYCGSEMEVLGYNVVREELHIIPMKLERLQYVQEVLICNRCKYEDDEPNIVQAPVPSPLIPHSLASPSSVAYIMYQKYVNAMPLYRQEQDLLRIGVRISRAVMANWVITCAMEYFAPIYDAMHTRLLKRAVIHADETTCQVLKEHDKKATAKSYMWLYVSGNDGLPGIVLFEYQPGRGAEYPKKFLEGFHGFLQTDAYDGYHELEEHLTRCACWAHARRYWFDALPGNAGKADAAKTALSPAEIGYAYCNKLFEYERGMADMEPDERKNARMEKEKPLLDKYWKWLGSLNPYGGSRLEKAVTYSQNHQEKLMNYLKDGRCSISNNLAENNVRPYVLGRKNFLFHNTPKGAQSSAIIYSLVQTARANNLDIYKYLQTVLLYMPDYKDEPDGIEELMPWSPRMQKECHKPVPAPALDTQKKSGK